MKQLIINPLATILISLSLMMCGCHTSPHARQTSMASEKQTPQVGGPCEGCEAIFEYGDRNLTWTDTLPGFGENEPKLLVEGTIFEADGTTPAEDVILYAYHTNRVGIYSSGDNATGWGRRHGMYRGWVRTGETGRYRFYTFRPAAYPNRDEPEHIHLTVKEPDLNEYYLDAIHFRDDPLLTQEKLNRLDHRGGSGVVELKENGSMLIGRRDIILGENIPDYPKK